MKKLIVTLILSISLVTGCAVFDGFKSIKESIVQVSDGNIIHKIKSVELTSTEITIIDHSFNNLKDFIDKWSKVDKVEDLDDFMTDYAVAKSNYLSIHKVIENNFTKYNTEFQTELKKYKKDATHVDDVVFRMVLAKDMYNVGKEAVKLAKIAIGLLK